MIPLLFFSPAGHIADIPEDIVLQKRGDAKWQIGAVAGLAPGCSRLLVDFVWLWVYNAHALMALESRPNDPRRIQEEEMQAVESEIQVAEAEIQAMIDRETAAWDDRDAEALVDLFHPDMVWPWPPDADSHDPATWLFPWGRYNRERWRAAWQLLFDTHTLVHNRRTTIKITVSAEGDGAFAVVDVDTLWRDQDGRDFHWLGRAGKGYTRVNGEWKLIMHTGLLRY